MFLHFKVHVTVFNSSQELVLFHKKIYSYRRHKNIMKKNYW